MRNIRQRLFAAILTADLASVEKESSGRLVNDFTVEADTATSAMFYSLQIVVLIIICLVYLASLVALSPTMTALSVALIAIMGLAARGLLRQTRTLGQATMEANQEVGAFLVERLKNLRLIRLSGTEKAENDHANRLLNAQSALRIDGDKLVSQLAVAMEPAAIGFAFFCLWFGSIYLGLGIETVGVFLVIILRLVPIAKDLIGARQVVAHTQPALNWIVQRLKTLAAAIEPNNGGLRFEGPKQAIRFENVHFHHTAEQRLVKALHGVSLSIPAGKMTALVGPSGSGKSTLIDLIPQLRRAQKGDILVDGTPLDAFDLGTLRAGVAFVSQAAQIFDVTPAQHVRYGRPGATLSEIENAARSANAFSFLSQLPNGFDTMLGEDGKRLSGGQRQRLDLARAIARQAKVLILDEPTSALDAESENEFQKALDSIASGGKTTIIVIAHRLSTIAHADQIVVLEAGRVTQTGTHESLMAAKGWYSSSWALQSGKIAAGAQIRLLKEDKPDVA